MMNMTEQLSLLRQSLGTASAMIGMEAEWVRRQANGLLDRGSGIVEAIHIREGRQYAEIGGELVDLEHIISVRTRSGGEA